MATSMKNLCECFKSGWSGFTQKLCFFILILFLFYTCTRKDGKENEFDYLMLSQRWLPTSCIEYVEKNFRSRDSHYCNLPKNFKLWTIHGLWPTQNRSLGPYFCNRSMPFDISKIEPIESDAKMYWPNIEGGKSIASLWQHEWEKHGTCAAQLKPLNSEIKYFNTTLSIYKKYNLQLLFSKNNIFPETRLVRVSDLMHVIKKNYGKAPQIHCIFEVRTQRPFLSEIRLCYNKRLELIDCGNIIGCSFGTKGLTNCPNDMDIIYPDNINLTSDFKPSNKNPEYSNYETLYNTLLFIRFLQWL